MPIVGPEAVDQVIAALLRGEAAVIPTDTVYGLVARPNDAEAVRALAERKGRDLTKPIQLLVASYDIAASLLDAPVALEPVRPFWPGGVTAVVRCRAGLNLAVVTAAGTLGLRVPADDLALAVLRAVGGMLAATSVNPAGADPATTAAAAAAFAPDLLVLDGGARPNRSSTVVDFTASPPRLLREGPVSAAALRLEQPSGR